MNNIIILTLGITIILLVGLFLLFHSKKTRKWIRKNLRSIALVVFIAGIVIYMFGFSSKDYGFIGSHDNIISLFLRSILASIGMFIANNSLVAVAESWKDCSLFMSFFAIIHFLAVIVSVTFLINLFGRKFVSHIMLIWYWIFGEKRDKLYIFFGVNRSSITLAKDISRKENKEKGKIVFIETSKETEEGSKVYNLFSLISKNTFENDYIEQVENVNAIVLSAHRTLSDKLIDEIKEKKKRNLFKALGLTTLGKVIKKHSEICFFMLANDENNYKEDRDNNLELACSIRKAVEENDIYLKDKKVDVYFLTRKNKFNTIFEDIKPINKGEFNAHIIDDAYISVLYLKQNKEYHPVNFVNINTKNATVEDDFTALIVGFSETGLEALKFVYEYSAFIGEDGKERKSKIYVVDKNMNNIKSKFFGKYPAFANREDKPVELIQCSDEEDLFYETIDSIIDRLNYVVVAVGDDIKGMSIATRIAEISLKHEKNNKRKNKLQIAVRSYNENNVYRLEEIQEHYNSMMISEGLSSELQIDIFGKPNQIWNYENIIEDENNVKAEEFDKEYDKAYCELHKEEQQEEGQKQKKPTKVNVKCFEKINKKKRTDYQNKSNAWHINTKMALIEQKDKEKYEKAFSLKKEYSTYDLEGEQEWIGNLAKCEHYRWIRANEMLGYQKGNVTDEVYEKDDINKRLGCMISCEEMSKYDSTRETIQYDFIVVKVSFILKDKMN